MIEPIPAIDLLDGACVRLERGDYRRAQRYPLPPLEQACRFAAAGFRRLHLVDLEGARAGHIMHLDLLKQITAVPELMVDFSGGIRSDSDCRAVLNAGARWITIGSMAIRRPAQVLSWLERFGPDRFILAADSRSGKLAARGWQQQTTLELSAFIRSYYRRGVRQFLSTDIDRDGMLGGPATARYAALVRRFPGIRLIASGGLRHRADLDALEAAGCSGAIIGKALYEGAFQFVHYVK